MQPVINALPAHERPRERLLRHGAAVLADRELLAMVLRNGSQARNAIDLASDVTEHAGSLARLATAQLDDLLSLPGMGLAKSSAVVAAFELGRRAVHSLPTRPLCTSADIVSSAAPHFSGATRERVVLLVADNALRLQRVVVLTDGTAAASLVEARDVLQAVLRLNGFAFALAHNHPSGSLQPSQQDVQTTHALQAAAAVVGLRFLDHVIVHGERWSSVLDA
jgi:DNA repair protein RadC